MDSFCQTCSEFSPQLPFLFLLYFCLGDLTHSYDFQNHLYSGDSHSYFFLSFLDSAPNLYILLAYLNVSEEFLKFAFWKQEPSILHRKSYIDVSIFKINGAITIAKVGNLKITLDLSHSLALHIWSIVGICSHICWDCMTTWVPDFT